MNTALFLSLFLSWQSTVNFLENEALYIYIEALRIIIILHSRVTFRNLHNVAIFHIPRVNGENSNSIDSKFESRSKRHSNQKSDRK